MSEVVILVVGNCLTAVECRTRGLLPTSIRTESPLTAVTPNASARHGSQASFGTDKDMIAYLNRAGLLILLYVVVVLSLLLAFRVVLSVRRGVNLFIYRPMALCQGGRAPIGC